MEYLHLIKSKLLPSTLFSPIRLSRVLLFVLLIAPFSKADDVVHLLTAALAKDSSIKAHIALERVSTAHLETAKWAFYPTPSISLQSAVSGFSTNTSERVISLSVQQPLWNGGRLQAGLDQAQADVALRAHTTQAKRVEVAKTVLQTYALWWVEHQKRLAWDQGVAVHQQFLKQVQRRVSMGVSANIDADLAQGRLSATLAEQNLALAQEQMAYEELVFLTGMTGLSLPDNAELPAMDLSLADYTQQLDAALHNSTKVKQAQARVAKALAEQEQDNASLWPQLYLQAERQIGDFSSANYAPQNTVFIGFSNQLKPGLAFQSDSSASKFAHVAALAEVRSEEQAVERKLRSSLILLASFDSRQRALNAARGNSKQVYKSFNRQFIAGRKDWQELLNSARELVQSDVQWAQAYGQYLVASWQLQLDIQGLTFLADHRS